MGRQAHLEMSQRKNLLRDDLEENEKKCLFRIGIPDSHKRKQIQKLFGIKPT